MSQMSRMLQESEASMENLLERSQSESIPFPSFPSSPGLETSLSLTGSGWGSKGGRERGRGRRGSRGTGKRRRRKKGSKERGAMENKLKPKMLWPEQAIEGGRLESAGVERVVESDGLVRVRRIVDREEDERARRVEEGVERARLARLEKARLKAVWDSIHHDEDEDGDGDEDEDEEAVAEMFDPLSDRGVRMSALYADLVLLDRMRKDWERDEGDREGEEEREEEGEREHAMVNRTDMMEVFVRRKHHVGTPAYAAWRNERLRFARRDRIALDDFWDDIDAESLPLHSDLRRHPFHHP